ncbi:lysosomal acid glucosylceramidase isoform X2 [Antennarius striatus]|uniref:lysosomal acid glucosylceramidase isoform X2 n=1 Tax=Antennarius striatus TaxID=241820 RepID=UPI0035B4B7D1
MALHRLSFRIRQTVIHARQYSVAVQSEVEPLAIYRTEEMDPACHTENHIGQYYTLPSAETRCLFIRGLARPYQQRIKTFNEASIMVRSPALEVISYLKNTDYSKPASRFLFYGPKGSGKTMSLCHTIHYCMRQGWLLLNVPDAHLWIKNCKELLPSSYNMSRFDQPIQATEWLRSFKITSEPFLSKIKTKHRYVWTKREFTEEGSSLRELVDQGITRFKSSTDVVGAVMKELRLQSGQPGSEFRLALAVDGVNALWGRSTIQKLDKSPMDPEELSLVHNLRKLITDTWTGGAIITTLSQTGSVYTSKFDYLPQELLGETGFDNMDPFIPVLVPNYSQKEFESCHLYYMDRKWLQHPQSRTEEGKKELVFLSSRNASAFDRLYKMALFLPSSILLALFLTAEVTVSAGLTDCIARDFGHESVVCECNSTYCDSVGSLVLPAVGQYSTYLTSMAGSRLEPGQGQVQVNSSGTGLRLTVNPNQKYQRIRGFGGAMTDAAAINIQSLSAGAQDQLLRQYFSPEGIGYRVVRVPMGSCDFSTRLYTYADTAGDYNLDSFTLAPEDINMKIPLLQRAQVLSPQPLYLLASAWTAPAWMKTNGALVGKGSLNGKPGGKEHKTWAQYYIRFLEEYAKYNLTFWAVTTGNEPSAGQMTNYSFQALGFTPEEQRDWVALDLGPALHSSHPQTHILILDDNRLLLPYWAKVVLSDIQAGRYINGVAVHWYFDSLVPAEISLGLTHHLYPEYYLFGTEACAGWSGLDRGVKLGSWRRAEQYAHDILEDLNHYVVGWTDWNLAVDLTGGPNWVKNFVDSTIIVDAQHNIFYKQPTFYAMAHFSKFLWEGSQRAGVSSSEETQLEYSAFIRPDGSVVLIILNRTSSGIRFEVWDPTVGYIPSTSPARSVLTLVWNTH